jgi:hypothetical protein
MLSWSERAAVRQVVDSTDNKKGNRPGLFETELGNGELLEGVEKAIEGMKPGDKIKVEIEGLGMRSLGVMFLRRIGRRDLRAPYRRGHILSFHISHLLFACACLCLCLRLCVHAFVFVSMPVSASV